MEEILFVMIDASSVYHNFISKNNTEIEKQINASLIANCTRLAPDYTSFYHVAETGECVSACNNYYLSSDDFGTYEDFEKYARDIACLRRCGVCHEWVSLDDLRTGASYWDRVKRVRYCKSCNALRLQREALERPHVDESLQQYVGDYHEMGNLDWLYVDEQDKDENALKGIGIEIEGESSDSDVTFIQENHIPLTEKFAVWNQTGDSDSDKPTHFKCERDGSLSRGVEFISAPMSFAYALSLDYTPVAEQLQALGADDANPHTGFHIHVSKLALGRNEKEQVDNAMKIAYWLHKYENDIVKMSGRQRGQMGYCEPWTMENLLYARFGWNWEHDHETGDCAYNWDNFPCGHAYSLINSRQTIEFRFFKSTSNAYRIKMIIEFIIGLVRGAVNTKWSRIYTNRMLDFINPKCLRYWRKRGIFVHTAVKGGDKSTYGEPFVDVCEENND